MAMSAGERSLQKAAGNVSVSGNLAWWGRWEKSADPWLKR